MGVLEMKEQSEALLELVQASQQRETVPMDASWLHSKLVQYHLLYKQVGVCVCVFCFYKRLANFS